MNPTVGSEGLALTEGLLRWACLLACAWLVHGLLRRRHPRSRILLWRVVLVLSFTLPWWQGGRGPTWSLRVSSPVAESLGVMTEESPLKAPSLVNGNLTTRRPVGPGLQTPLTTVTELSRPLRYRGPRSPMEWLIGVWAFGAILGGLRLARWHWQLHRLAVASTPVDAEFATRVNEVGVRLGLRGRVDARVSPSIRSPFICGFWRPRLLLPTTWLQELSEPEITALLRHELAHLKGQDLRWSIIWRWLTTVAWFQPLAWWIPRVHQLACEQDADRLAAGAADQRGNYAGLLARLALRALALPPKETQLAFNASSDLVRRLNHLGQGEPRPWYRRHSVFVAVGLGVFLLFAISWRISVYNGYKNRAPTQNSTAQVRVTVLTEDGKPIPNAIIQPDGLREQNNTASHYTWIPAMHGPKKFISTDTNGQAVISYPKYVILEENLRTVQISFTVKHPDYSPERPTEYPVDGSGQPIHLKQGAQVEVSGYFGPRREPVLELVPNLSSDDRLNWQNLNDGRYTCNQVTAGGRLVQLMGLLPGGEIGFSEAVSFTAEAGQTFRHQLELKPGIRLEGNLDPNVPRPVKNGRVIISIRPKEFPAVEPNQISELWERYGRFKFWTSYRNIDADGKFVFESIPPGEACVIVYGDGFCSRPGQLLPASYVAPRGFGVPQIFPLGSPMTTITVATEATVTVRVAVKTRRGQPLVGAKIYFSPNVLLIGTGLFGEMRRPSDEEPFRSPPSLSPMRYQVTTDEAGLAEAENLPAFISGLDLEHPEFDVPISPGHGSRYFRFARTLAPGATETFDILVEPKGKSLLGL